MTAVSLPVTRPIGRALVVASRQCRPEPLQVLRQLGFQCTEWDDPYAAMAELCQDPNSYRAMILSLNSLYREEMTLVQAVKRRFPHVEIWLTHIDGRQAALAEAMRMGADGLLSQDGLHRAASPASSAAPIAPAAVTAPAPESATTPARTAPIRRNEPPVPHGAAVLTAAALLAAATASASESASGPAADDDRRDPHDHPQNETIGGGNGDPLLTADELRALLQEQPSSPSSGDADTET